MIGFYIFLLTSAVFLALLAASLSSKIPYHKRDSVFVIAMITASLGFISLFMNTAFLLAEYYGWTT